MVQESSAKAEEVVLNLAAIQKNAELKPVQAIKETILSAQLQEENIDLDERETRRLIDAQLRAAGWEVDSQNLTYNKGTRPKKGKVRAIAEYPTDDGRADYALFVGLQIVAVVEAKRQSKDVYSGIDQAKRYSRSFRVLGEEILPGAAWGEYKVPFPEKL